MSTALPTGLPLLLVLRWKTACSPMIVGAGAGVGVAFGVGVGAGVGGFVGLGVGVGVGAGCGRRGRLRGPKLGALIVSRRE